MSIREALQGHVNSGALALWTPTMPGQGVGRSLFLHSSIVQELNPEHWADDEMSMRYGRLKADFDTFAGGDMIAVGMQPYDKDSSAFLARVDPVEYGAWCLRCYAPKPSIRVMGGFAEQDVFVALMSQPREMLDGPGGTKWMRFREDTLARWRDLFPGLQPLVSETIEDYLSEETYAV